MQKLFIRTINETFESRDDGRNYAGVPEARTAAIAAAANIASDEIKTGKFSVVVEGRVEELDGKVLAKMAVALCVGDLYMSPDVIASALRP